MWPLKSNLKLLLIHFINFNLMLGGTSFALNLTPNEERDHASPPAIPIRHSIETSDHKSYIIDSKNFVGDFSEKALSLTTSNDITYVRLNTSHIPSSLLPSTGSTGLLNPFLAIVDGSLIIDYKYDYSDASSKDVFIEFLFSRFDGEKDAPKDSASRWNKFYDALTSYFALTENHEPVLSPLNSSIDNEKTDDKLSIREKRFDSLADSYEFGKFSPKQISLKAPEFTFRFKSYPFNPDNDQASKVLHLTFQALGLEKTNFIKFSSFKKIDTNSKNINSDQSDAITNAIKSLFGLDITEIKKCIDEFQKITDNITNEESKNLRPFYDALALLLKNEAGIEVPPQPTLEDEVSSEELEWRKELDRLAYAILIGENTAVNGPDKTQLVSFRSKYRELFKNHVLPVKARYNQRIQESLGEFLKQLKDMLTNKTTQVVIKTTKDSTEFVVDVSAKSKN